MAQVVNYSVRIDVELKHRAEAIYSELGMNLSSAINAFLRQSVRTGGFPFDVRLSEGERVSVLTLASEQPAQSKRSPRLVSAQ